MGSRGRPATSLTQEQLMTLGVTSKDVQTVSNAIPPIYPPLHSKPVQLETQNARDYKILWREDYNSYLRDSPYYTNQIVSNKKFKSYYDYTLVFPKSKERKNSDFAWDRMPLELRPNWKRKKETTEGKTKKVKVVNINETLKVLEEKENIKIADVAENDSDAENIQEEGQDHDEEMDEDNDYGNSYFDNGDAYNDEDDNLDDGPVY